ncbi:MAG: hypothetical protein Kilf2KO_24120 [Rhodospirillales bacterium]
MSLAKQISDRIRRSIMNGSLKADDRLPTEQEFATRFQVSRPTIREALKRLAAQTLVRSRRGPNGDAFFTRKGKVAHWDVVETDRKILIIHDPEGKAAS